MKSFDKKDDIIKIREQALKKNLKKRKKIKKTQDRKKNDNSLR